MLKKKSIGEIPLRDSEVKAISIYEQDYNVCIEIRFKLMNKEKSYLTLKCIDVVNYGFSWNSDCVFYNVSHYKLFKEGDLYYLSLDPCDESSFISDDDNDFLMCRQMDIWLSENKNFDEKNEYYI